ncbi:MAG: phosphatase [Oscillospiraceae bacterium]|nr:phosphatase [Oscillospiraceae bacterium]
MANKFKEDAEFRKKYYKEWRAKNKDKVKANNERYLRKKALELLENEKNNK